jgi:hypothetical protein
MPATPVGSGTWMTLNAHDGLVRFCVDPRRKVSLRSILRKNLPRVAAAYSLALLVPSWGIAAVLQRIPQVGRFIA